MESFDMIEQMFTWLDEDIQALKNDVRKLQERNEIAASAQSFPTSTLVNAPLAAEGVSGFAVRFISDARKSGEGAGLGTGLPAWYDPRDNTWKTFHDNLAVTV